MAFKDGSKEIYDALTFSSFLLPNPEEAKQLRDSLRANYLPRETTRLRATVSCSAIELALYKQHLIALGATQAAHFSLSSAQTGQAFPSTELVAIDAAIKRLQTEHDALSSHSSVCSSALSPIRRLPAEILIQVFFLRVWASMNQWELNSKDYAAEMNRLTRRDLLQLSHVCAHWRAHALGTPAFWRQIDLDLMFWSSKMLPLVETALQRSARAPLQVRIGAPEEIVVDRRLLELIVQHCTRWQTATFCMDFSFFTSLSAAHQNLPLLESVYISGPIDDAADPEALKASAAVQLFSVAPRLVEFTFAGPAKALQSLPWGQLRRFEYLDVYGFEFADALSILPCFPPGLQFELRRLMFSLEDLNGVDFTHPPFTSRLAALAVEFSAHSPSALSHVLDQLTLQSLKLLEVASANYRDSLPILWDQPAFQRFCARSGCGTTLTVLYLLHVALLPADLLATVAELPALTELVVADHWVDPSGLVPEHVLLTDEVFRALAWNATPQQLLPNLRTFGCLTLLNFDEAVYLDFVRSRVVQRRGEGGQFESYVRWQPGATRTLMPEVLSALTRLEDEGLVGSIEIANDVEMQTFFYSE
ncbi:hypothetical protein FB451DRAFT_1364363 [Mycena latifolia]|nr:hypothetical protein FB451DRAFT_1364363 [Mycena latifolia]